MSIDEKISQLNIILPKATPPVGSYVATKQVGKLLYISGQISIDADGNLIKGYEIKKNVTGIDLVYSPKKTPFLKYISEFGMYICIKEH